MLFTIYFQSGFTKLYKPPVSKPKQNLPKKTQVRYLRSSSSPLERNQEEEPRQKKQDYHAFPNLVQESSWGSPLREEWGWHLLACLAGSNQNKTKSVERLS